MVYLLTFVVSIFFYAESNKTKHRYLRKILWCTSIMIPVLLAAFRGMDIGTDIKIYVEPTYRIAVGSPSFIDLINNSFATEILFNLLVYISAKVFGSIQFLLGAIQIIILLPIYIAIDRRVEKNSRVLVLFSYYLIFYGYGYNLMRQFMAISLFVLAFSYCVDRKKVATIVFLLLAIGFHNSAILAILLTLIYIMINKYEQKWLTYICALGIVLVTIGYQQLMGLAISVFPQFLGKYLGYMSQKWNNWPIADLILYFLILLIGIKQLQENESDKRYCGLMTICSFAGVVIASKMPTASRAMLYCNIFSIFDFSYMKYIFKKDRENQNMVTGIIVVILIVYWYVQYIYLKNNAIYPYEFVKLGVR